MTPSFAEAFHFCITHTSTDVYNALSTKISEYEESFKLLKTQYADTMKDLLNSHSQMLQEYSLNDGLRSIKDQHGQEVAAMHDNWQRQYESLHQTQASDFKAYVFELYHNVAVSKTFKPPTQKNVEQSANSQSLNPNPSSKRKEVQNQDDLIHPAGLAQINSLMEMGFDRKMARAALDLGKDNLEQAIMLLLETPGAVETHISLTLNTMKFEATKTPTPTGSPSLLRKSNSFFNINREAESNDSRTIPPIDWNRKRASSNSKINSKSAPTNPFKNMGNFLEKAMDAFRAEDPGGGGVASSSNPLLPLSPPSETFTAHIGTQQIRTMYNMQLCVKSQEALFEPIVDQLQANAVNTSTIQSLYSKSLAGLIVLVKAEELSSYGSFSNIAFSNIDFFNACNLSPELHFPSVTSQIANIKSKRPDEDEMNAREGDFFVTRHSNIPSIHIVFHLVTNGDIELSSQSDLIQGYRAILSMCHLCHVTQITIPVTLTATSNLSLHSILKRSEIVLKQTKGVFTELSRHVGIDHVSRQIIFLLPEVESDQSFLQTKEKLLSIFRI